MPKLFFAVVIFAVAITLPACKKESTKYGDRAWVRVPDFPEDVFSVFLASPRGDIGFFDIRLDEKKREENKIIVMAEIKGLCAVFVFRGVSGRSGFVVPESRVFHRMHILEIRWYDERAKEWRFWWNQEVLDDTFLARPGLLPIAVNAPL